MIDHAGQGLQHHRGGVAEAIAGAVVDAPIDRGGSRKARGITARAPSETRYLSRLPNSMTTSPPLPASSSRVTFRAW